MAIRGTNFTTIRLDTSMADLLDRFRLPAYLATRKSITERCREGRRRSRRYPTSLQVPGFGDRHGCGWPGINLEGVNAGDYPETTPR